MDVGRMAVVADPQGAFFEVWQPKLHIGANLVNGHGLLSWNELHTPDLEGATSFYTELFGWTTSDMDMGGMTYRVISVDGHGNGGLSDDDAAGRAAALARVLRHRRSRGRCAKIAELGGTVVQPPMDIGEGNRSRSRRTRRARASRSMRGTSKTEPRQALLAACGACGITRTSRQPAHRTALACRALRRLRALAARRAARRRRATRRRVAVRSRSGGLAGQAHPQAVEPVAGAAAPRRPRDGQRSRQRRRVRQRRRGGALAQPVSNARFAHELAASGLSAEPEPVDAHPRPARDRPDRRAGRRCRR